MPDKIAAHCNECFHAGDMVPDETGTPICPRCGEEALRDDSPAGGILSAAQILVDAAVLLDEHVESASPAVLDTTTVGEAFFYAAIDGRRYKVTIVES